jgi:hypothetical protein
VVIHRASADMCGAPSAAPPPSSTTNNSLLLLIFHGLPGVSTGINMPSFPELVVAPDYPVYYAPRGEVNLFFYHALRGVRVCRHASLDHRAF